MTDREIMQQALEALEQYTNVVTSVNDPNSWVSVSDGGKPARDSITALRDRLAQPNEFNPDWDAMAVMVEEQQRMAKRIAELEAQPEQEPVLETVYETIIQWDEGGGKRSRRELARRIVALYTATQPEQEPVAHTLNCVCGAVWDVSPDGVEEMVHAPNPPQRKPLTDERIKSVRHMRDVQGYDGNWNYDPYMQGLYNGLEFALSLLEVRQPEFKDAPATWLGDIKFKRDKLSSEAAPGIKENT